MPDADQEAMAIIGLHAKARRNKVLPCEGSLMEQPAVLLECFDVIDKAGEEKAIKDAQDREMAFQKSAKLAAMPGNRGR